MTKPYDYTILKVAVWKSTISPPRSLQKNENRAPNTGVIASFLLCFFPYILSSMPSQFPLPAMTASGKSKNTEWTLFASNEEAWNSILADCAKAEKSIDLEQFIFEDDEFGRKLIDVCASRASAGVKVRFLWDAIGSFSFFGSGKADELRQKGIELLFWKTLVPPYFKVPNYRSWYLRNHRRTLTIDGRTAYTGSMCVSDSMKNWRDTNVRLQGPVAISMQNAFDRMWERARKSKKLPLRKVSRDKEFLYVTNYPAPGRRHIYTSLIEAIRGAHRYIYITTPYFVPTHRLVNVLRNAARDGVDVRIILPEKTDHYPTLDLAARSFFSSLLESHVRIFLYQGNVIHSKSVAIDGTWATVGSMNLDSASMLYNFEANIISTNPQFAQEVTAHFLHDIQESDEVPIRDWKNRFFIEKIPEILIRLVSKFL